MDMQDKVNFCGVCEDISNSGKKLCMKFFRKTRLEKLHILIEWGIKIFLFIICVIYVKEVWCNWMKEDTNLKDTKTEIKIDHPTVVICFEPHVKITELKKYNISLKDFLKYEFTMSDANIANNWTGFYEDISYQIGRDFNISIQYNSNETWDSEYDHRINRSDYKSNEIDLEKIYTLWHGICSKIVPKDVSNKPVLHNYIRLHFKDSIEMEDLNNTLIKVFFTTESNSYGITTSKWSEGKKLSVDIEPKNKLYTAIDLTKTRFRKLKDTSNCQDECNACSYKCMVNESISKLKKKHSDFLSKLKKEARAPCMPINFKTLKSLNNLNLSICKTLNDSMEMFKLKPWLEVYNAALSCTKSCLIETYSGIVDSFIGYISDPKVSPHLIL